MCTTTGQDQVLSLRHQAQFWSAGFLLYFIWTLGCFWSLRKAKSKVDRSQGSDTKLHAADVFVWVCIAGIATTLLLATTNKITMDVASVPFLWILPLTLYLLSFIICFDKPIWYDRRFWIPLLFGVSILSLTALVRGVQTSIYFQVGAYLTMMFVGCMVCHGELYRLRPDKKMLTRYYLFISLGGAIGGIFVALVAPSIFDDYYELQLSWIALFLISGLCVFSTTHFRRRMINLGSQLCWTLWLALFTIFLFTNATTERESVINQVRGFYGVLKLKKHVLVEDLPSGADNYLSLMHGAIVHGTKFFKGGEPLFLPTAYYTPASGIGKAIGAHPDADETSLDVGVIGMGVASISALCRACRSLSFYEIDPNVVDFESRWFSNLETLRSEGVETNVFMGDGRSLLAQQWAQNNQPQYDVLAIDAFSGDSIPVHLITREAFELYTKHLHSNGVLAVHISNRHLELAPLVASLASDLGIKAAQVYDMGSEDEMSFKSQWILLSNSESFFSDIASDSVTILESTGGKSWTDEYSNLLSVLR